MLLAAFIMGFVGSLHCAAMCGPLVLAMPVVGSTKNHILASRLVYNSGRIAAYSVLGLVFGLLGKSLLLAGFQQSLSISAGTVMLVILLLGRKGANTASWRASCWIKITFRNFLQRRTYPAVFALGASNGLLPCGLVYFAGTASATSGELTSGALYMLAFGFGTLPIMLGIGLSGPRFMKLLQRFGIKRLVPITVSLVAVSLILRGLALGIPYLSPANTNGSITCSACIP